MAQIAFRFLFLKCSMAIDFLIAYIAVLVHQFLDLQAINYDSKKYDAVFLLTCLLLASRIFLNLSVVRKRKRIENEQKEQELLKIKLENERKKIENDLLKNKKS